MEKEKQLKLFELIEDYNTLRNMGKVKKVNFISRGAFGTDYHIYMDKSILQFMTLDKLEKIIHDKFHGYFGGHCKINILTDEILIQYSSYND